VVKGNILRYDEVTGEWRNLSLEIHNFYSPPNIKAIPLQSWTGPEGSRRLRLPDLKTVGT